MGHCVEDDGGGGVDGEGVDGVAHGDGNQKVENLANGGGQTFALITHKESKSLVGECGRRQEGLSLRGGAYGEDVVQLKKRKQGIDAWEAKDRNPKYTTHGGACGSGMIGVRTSDCENSGDSHCVRGAKKGSHVAGVHHLI